MKKNIFKLFLALGLSSLILSGCTTNSNKDPKQDTAYVVSIEKTGSVDNVDTYTITYSDGTTQTFTVTNGGIQGEPGEDGETPVITIGSNGHWYINGVDTGIDAHGVAGTPGKDGSTIFNGQGAPSNDMGKDGDSYIDLSTWNYYYKQSGYWLLMGNIKGMDGHDGNSLLTGNGEPASTLGKNGDSYIDFDTWNYFVKENGNWVFKGNIKTYSDEGVSPEYVQYSINDFRSAMQRFRPTRITNTQTYTIESEDIKLNFNSMLVVAYEAIVKSIYTYSYEKLNELVTGNESMISVVSGTIYSRGAEVGDGVEFVTEAESSATLKGLNFNEAYFKEGYTISKNVLSVEVKDEAVKYFFGNDYKIKDVKFVIELDNHIRPSNLTLDFETESYMDNLFKGEVHSETTYSYDLEVVNF